MQGSLQRICTGCETELVHKQLRESYPDSVKVSDLETRLTKEIIARQQAESRLNRLLRSPEKEPVKSSSLALSPSLQESVVQSDPVSPISPPKLRPEQRKSPELGLSPPLAVTVTGEDVSSITIPHPIYSSASGRKTAPILSIEQAEQVNIQPVSSVFEAVLEDSRDDAQACAHAQTFVGASHRVSLNGKDASHDGRLETVEEVDCVQCKQHQATIKRLLSRLQEVEQTVLPSRRSTQAVPVTKNCQCILA